MPVKMTEEEKKSKEKEDKSRNPNPKTPTMMGSEKKTKQQMPATSSGSAVLGNLFSNTPNANGPRGDQAARANPKIETIPNAAASFRIFMTQSASAAKRASNKTLDGVRKKSRICERAKNTGNLPWFRHLTLAASTKD